MGYSHDTYGILHPVGGGDPIPLTKAELTVGRRLVCDVRLDFENVSGKHAILSLVNGLWRVRDLGSTNGTTVNGTRISSSHSVMPDDELGFAGHLYTLDYAPTGPDSVLASHQALDQDVQDDRRRHSLMELAGLDTDGRSIRVERAKPSPEAVERSSADEIDFGDAIPSNFKPKTPADLPEPDEDDFLKLIEEEVVKKSEE